MNILCSVSDWFTNPDSPWYYVVGTAFLLVVLALLTLFIVLSNKKNKKLSKQQEAEKAEAEAAGENKADTENTAPNAEKEPEPENDNDADNSVNADEPETVAEVSEPEAVETAEASENEATADEASEKPENIETAEQSSAPEAADEKSDETAEPKEKTAAKKSRKPKDPTIEVVIKTPSNAKAKAVKSTAPTKAAKTVKTTKSSKPFIDLLLADKSVHEVYNELKNTILSYPGIKAKLTKEDECFLFGDDKKAAFKLNGEKLELHLSLEPSAVPSQFDVVKTNNAELPVKLSADAGNIDTVQKAIVFSMNVSMLTRNASHRRVDYIKRALDAKQRAKNKK